MVLASTYAHSYSAAASQARYYDANDVIRPPSVTVVAVTQTQFGDQSIARSITTNDHSDWCRHALILINTVRCRCISSTCRLITTRYNFNMARIYTDIVQCHWRLWRSDRVALAQS